MSKGGASHRLGMLGNLLVLTLTTIAPGCCLVAPAKVDAGGQVPIETPAKAAIPILITLAADEGELLSAARTRVMARLKSTMSAEAFAAVRTYEALPVIALAATPEVLALILTLSDVRSVEADRTLDSFSRSVPRHP